jgi:hypothetical protein
MRFIQYLIIGKNQVFGKLLTNQKIAYKIVKPYVYKALREGLKFMTTVKYKISEGSIPSLSAANGSLENFFEDVSSHSFNSDTEVTYLLSYVAAMNYVAVSYAAAGSPPPPWDCLRASAGLACSVFGLILGPPTLGATFYISIAGLANSLHSVSTDCFD